MQDRERETDRQTDRQRLLHTSAGDDTKVRVNISVLITSSSSSSSSSSSYMALQFTADLHLLN